MCASDVFSKPAEGTAFYDLIEETFGHPYNDGTGHTTKTWRETYDWHEGWFRKIEFPEGFPEPLKGIYFMGGVQAISDVSAIPGLVEPNSNGRPGTPYNLVRLAHAQTMVERELAPGFSDAEYDRRAAEAFNFGATRRRNGRHDVLQPDHIYRARKRAQDDFGIVRKAATLCLNPRCLNTDLSEKIFLLEGYVEAEEGLSRLFREVWEFWRLRHKKLKPKRFRSLEPADRRFQSVESKVRALA